MDPTSGRRLRGSNEINPQTPRPPHTSSQCASFGSRSEPCAPCSARCCSRFYGGELGSLAGLKGTRSPVYYGLQIERRSAKKPLQKPQNHENHFHGPTVPHCGLKLSESFILSTSGKIRVAKRKAPYRPTSEQAREMVRRRVALKHCAPL